MEVHVALENQVLRGRFAPSPSGRMHLGNLFAALLAWLDIRAKGGELLLRMEDLDPDRCRPEYIQQLADDLRWFGLTWDMGWKPGDTAYLQSRRRERYEMAFQQLMEQGLLYPCYCNRRERLAASAPHTGESNGVYSGHCRQLTAKEKTAYEREGRRPAYRIRTGNKGICFTDENYGFVKQNIEKDSGDFIIRRSDGVYAYQLAVVVDDGEMGVNRVVRGRDLLASTPSQIWLGEQLGLPKASYAHLPLLTDAQGRRLSKRDRDLDVGYLRSQVKSPQVLVGFLAYKAGLMDRMEPIAPQELVSSFFWEQVGREDRVVEAEQHRGILTNE